MKITNYLVIYLLIITPLLVYSQWRAEDTNTFAKLNHQYDGAMKVAGRDSVDQLRVNAAPNYESGYPSEKFVSVNKQEAFDTFLHSLSLNFESEDESTQDLLSRYVPVFAVLEYDGFSMNVYSKLTTDSGPLMERTWLSKIPFTFSDRAGNIVQFTLDDYVTVYDAKEQEWYEGPREAVAEDVAIPLLDNPSQFDQVRRDTIVNTVQENIAYRINQHNVYAKGLGITYKFTMPLIPHEDWYNTVDDVGVFAFFQGYPYERGGGVYNQYAFEGSRLARNEVYYATTVNGQKVFYTGSCEYDYPPVESYPTKKAAAKAGYRELSCLNEEK